jgi:23S rRNA pseudouridine2605 synthase
MPEARIQKVLADAGVASRRTSEALVAAGRVQVNGEPAVVGQRVDPTRDRIEVDGTPLRSPSTRVYLALHKPAGVTSTVADRHADRTVVELVPDAIRRAAGRLYPVGRLDRDSEGLLLLTNDGDWAQELLHPRHEVEREYAVGLRRPLTERQAHALQRGIRLDEGLATLRLLRPATAAEVRRLPRAGDAPAERLAWYLATIAQGWRRQLRRMFAAVEAPVERLVRVRIGTLRLADLAVGDVRRLSTREAGQVAASRGSDVRPSDRPAGRPSDRTRKLATAPGAGASAGDGPIVSLDGPGSSGKSSVGAGAASRLGYRFCDTGLLYRALTWLALERDVDLADEAKLVTLIPEVELAADREGRLTHVRVAGRDVTRRVHSAHVDRRVSELASQAAVREALLPRQRQIAAGGRIIMAGRDIGTVVIPGADVKLYLQVSAEERARRRAAERGLDPEGPEAHELALELRRRDEVDSTRTVAPLRIPEGATIIDSEHNTLEETIEAVVRAIEARLGERGLAPRAQG